MATDTQGTPWWICSGCGFTNRPRHVANSLGLLPAGHQLFELEWRVSHCEQCGRERSIEDPDYQPTGR